MSKSLIYTANPSAQNLTSNSIISLGTVVRRFGPNLALSGNAIQVQGGGYYEINSTFTVSPSAVGNVTITAFLDGVAIPGATATGSVSTANNFLTLPITGVFRQPCQCCEGVSNLTFVITGTTSSVANVAVKVKKD